MNNSSTTDRRVVKTKKAIHQAYVELMSSKGQDNITVKEISDLADVNRKTFYNHYNDMSELVDEIENEIIDAFDKALAGIDLSEVLVDPDDVSRRLCEIGFRLRDLCSHLMEIEYDGELVTKISNAILASIMRSNGNKHFADEKTEHMLIEFGVAGMMQSYQTWFYSDRSEPIGELTAKIARTIVYGIYGIIKSEEV